MSRPVSHGQPRVRAAARLERLPFSRYHGTLFIVIALAFFFDSVDLGTMTFVLGSIKQEFGLSSAMAGLVASASFFGMVLGAAVAGLLADRFGRRPVFQWSMVLWGVASYLCSTAQTVDTLIVYRIVLGIGMGMEFPVAQALLSEFVPTASRGRLIALMDGFWPLGFITAGIVSYFTLAPLGWRTVFALLAIPAAFVLVVRRIVPESPRWLEHRGRDAQAEAVLASIEAKVMRASGLAALAPLGENDHIEPPASRTGAFREIWSGVYRKRTLMVWTLWFFALLGFYGLTSWLGALMQQAGITVTKSVLYTVLISLAGIPGFLCAAWLVERWGRKPTCVASLTGGAAMAYLYGQALLHGGELGLVIAAGLAMQFFLFGMWAALYTYTPELYGTGARATGSGFASAIGRVGSLIGPYAVGLVLPVFGQSGVFTLGALSFALAAAAVALLGIETKGLALEALATQPDLPAARPRAATREGVQP
ncbi:MFS transporter [Trinickia caryophylli]|uniref:MFS transporter, putative metabolite:H+ symporter n=1 Tax=Trinickia caryophylli TaxID=28094 RepID=A0A1X7E6Z2_TRICW|nr:MFS transporter [Trinickia caryophylli]PMS13065.1 MFS transporter [Trinickia caryophylli]TRX14830.1 MFS transporter [Trinickia caryophylli]WQE14680.1 MFS transporter [Trinickia caryophylli]SMF28671.1 MFS transporter, putative metabolite:H+ symporter [Trinickia caryophylli]GLU31895.1 MFS sugar transporter [Trinickia caryophylli]